MNFVTSSFHHELDSLESAWNSYERLLPRGKTVAIGRAFVFSFVVGSFITGNPVVGLASGGAAALATTIHAMLCPLFKNLFEKRQGQPFNFVEETIRGGVTIITSALLLNSFDGGLSLRVFKSALFCHALFAVLFPAYRCSSEKATIVFM